MLSYLRHKVKCFLRDFQLYRSFINSPKIEFRRKVYYNQYAYTQEVYL